MTGHRLLARGRPTVEHVVLVGLLGAALAACGTSTPSVAPSSSPTPVPSSVAPSASAAGVSPSPAPPSPSPVPPSPVDGVVIKVDATGPTKVSSFTIRTSAGEELTFAIGTLEAGSFNAGHLPEHMATAAPVRVTFTVDGERLVATRLEDAD